MPRAIASPPMNDALKTPVAIVGGGPVGLMLALFLDRHGIQSVVFNSDATTRWHPKGSTHNSRSMEHHRRLGIAESIRALGLPADHPTDVAYFTRFNAYELARLAMPSSAEKMQAVAASSRFDQTPEPIHRGNQMYVERFLFDHASTRPNITLRFGREVTTFEQHTDHVTLTAVQLESGATEHWRADYLVGCDGGRSFVRRTLGIRYAGEDTLQQDYFGGRMFSTYLRAPTLYRDFLGRRRAFQYWAVNPQLRTTIIALNGEDEFLFWMKPKDPRDEPDDATVKGAVALCTGAELPVEIIAHAPWTAGVALYADAFGEGRVLLAGDAVHLFTPTGGFGMNTGIEDAANLAWKLAATLQGWGDAGLLASYEAERKPIAIRNTNAARELAKSIGDVNVSPALEQASNAGEAARHEVGSYLSTFGEEFASLGVQLGARYDGSPIIASDEAAPQDSFVQYVPTSIPGGRAPHLWIGGGRGTGDSLFDHFGVGFTLLRLGKNAPDASGFQNAAKSHNIPLEIVDVPDTEAREFYGYDLALIRPDQHVAWRGDDAGKAESILKLTSGGSL
jgi:2-polyprenyl-6-methoxyphenol hydroxylase-like FAD-dependent oxidoreductase